VGPVGIVVDVCAHVGLVGDVADAVVGVGLAVALLTLPPGGGQAV